MATFKLDYVHTFYDARGKLRHVFRRRGQKQVTIKGKPGTLEFMEAYHALLDQAGGLEIGATHVKAGTVDAVILRYLRHDRFTKELTLGTQATRRRILDHFRACVTPSGRRYGDNRFATIQRNNITDALAGKPGATQRDWLKAIRHLVGFAIAEGELRDDPTVGIKTARPAKSSGYVPWTITEVEKYRERHPLGTTARAALEMAINLAARRTDIHLIGRQHLRDGRITWRPSKTLQSTGKLLSIKVLPELQAALDAKAPSDALTFVRTEHARAFASAAAFGNRFATWCRQAGLKPVVCDDGKVRNYRCHGLRKYACTRLAEAECSAMQIMQVSGHATLSEAQKYVDAVNQQRMSDAALARLDAGSKPVQGGG